MSKTVTSSQWDWRGWTWLCFKPTFCVHHSPGLSGNHGNPAYRLPSSKQYSSKQEVLLTLPILKRRQLRLEGASLKMQESPLVSIHTFPKAKMFFPGKNRAIVVNALSTTDCTYSVVNGTWAMGSHTLRSTIDPATYSVALSRQFNLLWRSLSEYMWKLRA